MLHYGKDWGNGRNPKKQSNPPTPTPAGACQNDQAEIFIGNLPPNVTEREILVLLKGFGIRSMKICNSDFKSFGFVELMSAQAAQLAVLRMNGVLWQGQRITVAMKGNRPGHGPTPKSTQMPGKVAPKEGQVVRGSPQRKGGKVGAKEEPPTVHESPQSSTEMPALEPIPWEELGLCCRAVSKDAQLSPSLKPEVLYAVPMEMRGSFLLQMSKDCFQDATWLFSVPKIRGKMRLLVMDTIPQTPYFWAVPLTEEAHQKTLKLFTALAEAEAWLPSLARHEVRPGMRCLAESSVGAEGNAWNRCWVLDRGEELAVVFFVDFGYSATVPASSLRNLDADEFWAISPLAQPFELQGEVFSPQVMRRQVLEGTVTGQCERELHILKFLPQAE